MCWRDSTLWILRRNIDVRAALNVATRFCGTHELAGSPAVVVLARFPALVVLVRLPLSKFRRNSARFEETPRSRRYSIFHRLGVTSCSQRSGESPQFAEEAFWERTTPEVIA